MISNYRKMICFFYISLAYQKFIKHTLDVHIHYIYDCSQCSVRKINVRKEFTRWKSIADKCENNNFLYASNATTNECSCCLSNVLLLLLMMMMLILLMILIIYLFFAALFYVCLLLLLSFAIYICAP